MRDYQVSSRYACALMGLAGSLDAIEALDESFTFLIQIVDKHPEISHLLLNSTISKLEKEDFVDKIFPQEMPRLLVSFAKALIRKGRFVHIREIQETFHKLFEKEKGLQQVEAITAIPLSKKSEDRLKSVLKEKLNAEIILTATVDPQIMGGLIIRFDGKEINSSFASHLSELRQKLLK